jgi:hypothetical protein
VKLCSVENCHREIIARNLCTKHYQQAKVSGTLPPPGRTGRTRVPVSHPIYKVWSGIKTRCTNTARADYTRYGGAGIAYDPSWEDFNNFYDDMGESYEQGLWLDRIDNSQGYSKDNCRWVTPTDSNRNRVMVKVSEDLAEEVRAMYRTGHYTQTEIGVKFNLDQTTVSDIVRFKTWK